MSISFTVKADVSRLTRRIDDLVKKHVPFVTAYALTKTAQDIKAAEIDQMKQVFDRPTRFTLNALFVQPATKQDLQAMVYFKDGFGKAVPAWRYLGPQVRGGPRAKKSHERVLERAGVLRADEFVMPGQGVVLDSSGNMKPGDIVRILSQLQAFAEVGHLMNASDSKRSKKARKAGRYFLVRGKAIPDGIYLRKDGRSIVPVMIFAKAPRYEARFPFYETAERVHHARFVPNFRDGWERYVVSQPVSSAA